jgi:peptidoglycan/xylan/chitin deacetylase (PgdA/CDA1 family)
VIFVLSIAASCLASDAAARATDREIAITIDDLPARPVLVSDHSVQSAINPDPKVLAILQQQKVPTVGFVIGKRIYKWGEVDQRIKSLAMWVGDGAELGNHTYSHLSLDELGAKKYEDDIVQGEPVISLLMAERHKKLRYFRYPFLATGTSLEIKWKIEAFLAERGYTNAPVTVDPWDWMFAGVYDDARQRGDSRLQQQVVEAYLSYLESAFDFSEQLSRDLVGYEIRQVLLLHSNLLNAEHLTEVLEKIRARGYRFITLEEALNDPAYSLPDTYVGDVGNIWLQHWAVTRGQPRRPIRPDVPQWVIERWNALPHFPEGEP